MIYRTLMLLVCFALVPNVGYGQGGLFSGDGTALRILGAVGQAMNNQPQGQFQQQGQGQFQNQGFQNQGFQNGFNNQGFNNQGFNNQGNQGFNNQGFNQQRHTTYKPGNYTPTGNGAYRNSVTGSTYIPNKGVLKSNGRFYRSIGNGVYQNADGATYMPSTGQYNSGSRGYIPPR